MYTLYDQEFHLKMYSAFVSSVYQSLRDERDIVINSLIDCNIFPICMEHFVISSNEDNINDIYEKIGKSDLFILILGNEYGSIFKNKDFPDEKKSYTEKEYEYALSCGKRILAIDCRQLDVEHEPQESQFEFIKRVPSAFQASSIEALRNIVKTFWLTLENKSALTGWIRPDEVAEQRRELEWKRENSEYDLAGEWYHCHMSEEDENYIRIGKIKIEQTFTRSEYNRLTVRGSNYKAQYDRDTGKIDELRGRATSWRGDNYVIRNDGVIIGIYEAERKFSDEFAGATIDARTRRGIHVFSEIVTNENGEPVSLEGSFQDAAPSPKKGIIYIFKSKEDRDTFLYRNRKEVLENIQVGGKI